MANMGTIMEAGGAGAQAALQTKQSIDAIPYTQENAALDTLNTMYKTQYAGIQAQEAKIQLDSMVKAQQADADSTAAIKDYMKNNPDAISKPVSEVTANVAKILMSNGNTAAAEKMMKDSTVMQEHEEKAAKAKQAVEDGKLAHLYRFADALDVNSPNIDPTGILSATITQSIPPEVLKQIKDNWPSMAPAEREKLKSVLMTTAKSDKQRSEELAAKKEEDLRKQKEIESKERERHDRMQENRWIALTSSGQTKQANDLAVKEYNSATTALRELNDEQKALDLEEKNLGAKPTGWFNGDKQKEWDDKKADIIKRKKALNKEREDLKDQQKTARSAMSSDVAKALPKEKTEVKSPAAGTQAAAHPDAIPQEEATDKLKSDPSLAEAYDEAYGKGAAAKVLGEQKKPETQVAKATQEPPIPKKPGFKRVMVKGHWTYEKISSTKSPGYYTGL